MAKHNIKIHCTSRKVKEYVLSMKGNIALIQIRKFYDREIVIIFVLINLNTCFWCSKEPSHRDSTFEYQQHMF